MRIRLHFSYLLAFVYGFALAQTNSTAGGYTMRHYGVKSYGMHPRNFYIAQDHRGVMYFGNAYGVLEYDGKNWRSMNLPYGNSGLSMLCSTKGTMYIGGFNELGLLEADNKGSLHYSSLYTKIPESKKFNRDIQSIIENENKIIFHAELGLHIFENDTFQTIEPHTKGNLFTYVCKMNNTVYVHEKNYGLLKLINNKLILVPGGEQLKSYCVKEIIPWQDGLLIIEKNNLSFLKNEKLTSFNEAACHTLRLQEIKRAIKLSNNQLLITTYNNGFYLIDSNGAIIRHVCVKNGLPDNTINYAYVDQRGGLWLALDNGIAYLEINTPFSFMGTHAGIMGMGYTSAVYNGKLYVGTSQGVYYAEIAKNFTEKQFLPVKGISGQVWDLSIINNALLCCQNDRTYQIKGDHAQIIPGKYDDEGHWKISVLNKNSSYAIKGTYLGLQLYKYTKGKWEFSRKLEGFDESCRTFEEDEDGDIWVCHGNKGMYRIKIMDDLSAIQSAENMSIVKGFKPDYFNFVSKINDRLVFSADDGLYLFDKVNQQFSKDSVLEKIIGPNRFIARIVQYDDRNIWVFDWANVNLYSYQSFNNYKVEENVFRKIGGELIGSYEFVMPLSSSSAILGSQDGFTFFDMNASVEEKKNYQVLIRRVEANFKNDSLLYDGNSTSTASVLTLPYDFNALRINYSAVYYENPEKITYQYALSSNKEKELNWSSWTTHTQVDFSNLVEGTYTFHVRAQNIYDQMSEESIYSFVVLPPWYRSWWAYTFYSIVSVLILYFLYKYIKIRFRRQQEKMELQKREELLLLEQKHITEHLKNEKELIALRNAKLEADMIIKNNELATLATTVTQKTEFLAQLKDKLENIHKDSENTDQQVFKEVIKTIDQDLDFDDNWSQFQIHFDQLHHNFLHRLREKYPKLNPSWLLLCAYIRMNKSNKEIAALMNISLSGVEKRKYRLREKLGLEGEDRLADFITTF